MHVLAAKILAGSIGAALALASVSAGQATTVQSVGSSGLIGTDTTTWTPNPRLTAISVDGRYVAFSSTANNLAPNDGNQSEDVFLHDRQSGSTECVSVNTAGATALGASCDTDISDDGRFVVFYSSSALIPSDTNGKTDIYVRDRTLGSSALASVSSGGVLGNKDSQLPRISTDGRCVVFNSAATNLVAGANGGVFLRDLVNGTTELATRDATGLPSQGGNPEVSGDGAFVCFQSESPNLVAGYVSTQNDIFVRDRVAALNELASPGIGGGGANGDCWLAKLSGDGRFVAYESEASNLVANDTNGVFDVFVYDRQLGVVTRASVDSSGAEANGYSAVAVISADGRLVAFHSGASSLVPFDTNGASDVFLRDVLLGTTIRVSVAADGSEADGFAGELSISSDGRYVVFENGSTNLTATPIATSQVYVRDTELVGMPIQRYCTAKTNSAGCTPKIHAVGAPLTSGFDSFFVVAYQVLPNKNGVFFWGLTPLGAPFGGGTLCVKPPIVRSPVQSSKPAIDTQPCTSHGTYSFHFRQSLMATHGLTAGDTVYGQFWSRDPGFVPPNNIGLTDAIRFTLVN